uniref:Uncharacterized protein n=1 Tax=Amphimedon queenslandica TaxID=400682 RepID=A0A1X7VFU2_AMPQE
MKKDGTVGALTKAMLKNTQYIAGAQEANMRALAPTGPYVAMPLFVNLQEPTETHSHITEIYKANLTCIVKNEIGYSHWPA